MRISTIKVLLVLLALAWVILAGCRMLQRTPPATDAMPHKTYTLEVTGYCHCGSCCSWKRTWWGRPVLSSGPRKGTPKKIGETASGTRAKKGTIAADTRYFPFGTIMYVPGYGYGRVEDRGSDIKGHKIDLYFSSHATAERWGRQRLVVKVWVPPEKKSSIAQKK